MIGDYELLDSGLGRKLELIAGVKVDRQAPAALWRPEQNKGAWKQLDGLHRRSDRGGGHWEWETDPPKDWQVNFGGIIFRIKATPFGHVGFFAEQKDQWEWIRARVAAMKDALGREPQILNLFAYTGGSTLAAAQAGASVTHVDAAKGIVDWARENAKLNKLDDAPVRWIVEDCSKFLQREVKRKRRYDGIILDPPSFGRGQGRAVWKIENDLDPLLASARLLCGEAPGLALLSAHSPGYTPICLTQVLGDHFDLSQGTVNRGEMSIPQTQGDRVLPAGAYARFARS